MTHPSPIALAPRRGALGRMRQLGPDLRRGDNQAGLAVGVSDDRLTVTWDETGGPSIDKISEPGFGTKLLKSALSAFDGKTEVAYLKTGLHCIMQCRIPKSE